MCDGGTEGLARELNELGVFDLVPSGMSIYAFGSALVDRRRARDLDILLIYPDGDLEVAHRVANQIRNTTPNGLVDVLAMSRTEERATAFVASERARPLARRPADAAEGQ